jgi:hypothetical protein
MLKGELMKNTFALLLVMACLVLGACQKKSDNQPSGGVDGSGGDLSYWDDKDLESWIKLTHKSHVRDFVHRLFLVKENSPEDLGQYRDLTERFLGNDKDQLLAEIDKVSYKLVQGRCSSSDNNGHKDSDGAYSAGTICLSYQTFKNMSYESLVPKLIIMSLHELAHMRGFSEEDAVRWQLVFDGKWRLSKKILTWQNYEYKEVYDTLKSIDQSLSSTYSAVINKWEDSKIHACGNLTAAVKVSMEFSYLSQWTPNYIKHFIGDEIQQPLLSASGNCAKTNQVELLEKLNPIVNALITANRMMAQFDSPFCTGMFCLNSYPSFSVIQMLKYEKVKSLVKKNKKPNPVKFDKIKCALTRLDDGAEVPLKITSDDDELRALAIANDPRFLDLKGVELQIMYDVFADATAVLINHSQTLAPLDDANDFVPRGFDLVGFFFSAEQKEISTRFVTIQERYAHADYLVYSSFNQTLTEAPPIISKYEARCSLGY